jgi:competence protein ComEC
LVAIFVSAAAFLRRRAAACAIFLALGIFFIALAAGQLDAFFFSTNQIGLFTDQSSRLAQLELRLIETPRVTGGTAEMRRLPVEQNMAAEVQAVRTSGGWEAASGRVAVNVETPDARLAAGQVICALGFLSRPEAAENPGQFDYASYERGQRVLATFRIRRPETIEIVSAGLPSPLVGLRQAARVLLAGGFNADQALNAAFLRMLTLGDAEPLAERVRQEFILTGTAYQLSISGLHIAIIGGSVLVLLRVLRIPPRPAVWTSLAAVCLYAMVALPSQTGVRALVMCVVGGIALLGRRATDALQALAVAVSGILLFTPADLSNGGFQIGVAAVLGLILLGPRVHLFVVGLWRGDEPWVGCDVDDRPAVWLGRVILQLLWRTFLASAIVWVTILPLVAYHFQQTNPWTVPGGFVLLPMTVAALLGGVGKILLTIAFAPLAHVWAIGAAAPAALLRHAVAMLAAMPGASEATAPPPVWAIVVYYALLGVALIPWQRAWARWAARAAPVAGCLAFLLLPQLAARTSNSNSSPGGGVRITFLSIGAGQSALVRVQGGECFFMDCGSSTVPDVFQRVIEPYLYHEGIGKVDEIFLSHGDYDHISAASEIIQAFHVRTVRMTPYFRPHATGVVGAEALLHFLDTSGPTPTLETAGDRIDVGGGASLQVLWAPLNCQMDSNNCGMVVKLSYAGKTMLFPADIQVPPEVELLKKPGLLKSDVLVGPHHGSAESSTLSFIQTVNPSFIVCSNAQMLTHKQIEFDQLAAPWPVYRTSRCGMIDVTIGADGRVSEQSYNGAGPVEGERNL